MKPVPQPFAGGALLPQEERLEVARKKGKLQIGVPKETCLQENRVALTPDAVQLLVGRGHEVVVESGAGLSARFPDLEYSEAGATMVYRPEDVFQCATIVKVEPPSDVELAMLKPQQTLISALQLKTREESYFKQLQAKRMTALALEYIRDEDGVATIMRTMSEIAGSAAILIAAEHLSNTKTGKGYLLGGVSGIPPAEVLIIGAGTVGTFAAKSALGLGATVKIFDNSLTRLRRLQGELRTPIYTSVVHPAILAKNLASCDVAIGALRSENGRTPCVVTEAMVQNMKPGSVIVDVSIDQGGVFETSELTDHDHPVFIKDSVVHYCVPNIPSRVARTASVALSHILAPLLLEVAESGGVEQALRSRPVFRHGLYLFNGLVTSKPVADVFNLNYRDPDLILGF
jgi:alanine dehydrogenase